jgi:SAM-dependent methyltransferase
VSAHAVVWHDLECGSYTADLPLWRELAERETGPVLDVGAGTGRVALDLAARGHAVTAVDRDPVLLAALRERAAAAGLEVDARVADATALDLGPARFGLVLVPMQTIQLLDDRPAFLRAVRRHLAPGGLFAAALAEALEGWDSEGILLPAADVAVVGGWRYASQPVAVREREGRTTIERIRTTLAPDGTRGAEPDAIDLAHLEEAELHEEGAAAGLEPVPGLRIDETEEHVGSEVVMLRG